MGDRFLRLSGRLPTKSIYFKSSGHQKKVYTIKEPSNSKNNKMDYMDITFEVSENPSREPIIKHREDGEIEIVFQMTQEQMNEVMIRNLKKRPK